MKKILCKKKDLCAIVSSKGKVRGYDGWPELFEAPELDSIMETGDSAYLVEVTYTVIKKVR